MPKIYTNELKRAALDLINAGMTQKQVWANLGISKSAIQICLHDSWLSDRGLEPAKHPDKVTFSSSSTEEHPGT